MTIAKCTGSLQGKKILRVVMAMMIEFGVFNHYTKVKNYHHLDSKPFLRRLSPLLLLLLEKKLREKKGTVIAQVFMPGMSMNPHVDATIGVDLVAIVSMGYYLAGDPSSAGTLAGAGVY
jgi:hypothetical protein